MDQLNASIIILREFLTFLLEDSQQEDDARFSARRDGGAHDPEQVSPHP